MIDVNPNPARAFPTSEISPTKDIPYKSERDKLDMNEALNEGEMGTEPV